VFARSPLRVRSETQGTSSTLQLRPAAENVSIDVGATISLTSSISTSTILKLQSVGRAGRSVSAPQAPQRRQTSGGMEIRLSHDSDNSVTRDTPKRRSLLSRMVELAAQRREWEQYETLLPYDQADRQRHRSSPSVRAASRKPPPKTQSKPPPKAIAAPQKPHVDPAAVAAARAAYHAGRQADLLLHRAQKVAQGQSADARSLQHHA
jgi:hypothetical protein